MNGQQFCLRVMTYKFLHLRYRSSLRLIEETEWREMTSPRVRHCRSWRVEINGVQYLHNLNSFLDRNTRDRPLPNTGAVRTAAASRGFVQDWQSRCKLRFNSKVGELVKQSALWLSGGQLRKDNQWFVHRLSVNKLSSAQYCEGKRRS